MKYSRGDKVKFKTYSEDGQTDTGIILRRLFDEDLQLYYYEIKPNNMRFASITRTEREIIK